LAAGTDPLNLLNWVSDFYLGRPSADSHEGFQDAAAAVWTEIGTAIERSLANNRPLFVAGHSLGAAIAIVTADRAHSEKKLMRAEIYIFGAPRVGRTEFVTRYNSTFGPTTYRFVHGKDIVPTVPPPELGFHHVGRLLQCERGERFEPSRLLAEVSSDQPSPGDDFFSGIAERVRDLFGGPLSPTLRVDALGQLSQLLAPSIGDHLPDRYYNALRPALRP
jgi:triacylglycerol lipase